MYDRFAFLFMFYSPIFPRQTCHYFCAKNIPKTSKLFRFNIELLHRMKIALQLNVSVAQNTYDQEFYEPKDFRVGDTISVLGRRLVCILL